MYLCIHCQKLLLRKKKLNEELAEVVTTIDAKLRLVTVTEIGPRKRTLSETVQEAQPSEGVSGSSSPDVIVSTGCS